MLLSRTWEFQESHFLKIRRTSMDVVEPAAPVIRLKSKHAVTMMTSETSFMRSPTISSPVIIATCDRDLLSSVWPTLLRMRFRHEAPGRHH